MPRRFTAQLARTPRPRAACAGLPLLVGCALLVGCKLGPDQIDLPPLPLTKTDAGAPSFSCKNSKSVACENNVFMSCKSQGEFLEVDRYDCTPLGQVCDLERRCITCTPNVLRCRVCAQSGGDCDPNVIEQCDADGNSWQQIGACSLLAGDVCDSGKCQNMCKLAEIQRSYRGCTFWPVDLDNAAIDNLDDATHQQYAVAVANPQSVPVDVKVQINDAAFGTPVSERVIDSVTVPPGALEVFKLPRRVVDGSSDTGLNDGTNTAVSSNAFQLSSSHPIVAYQFNPLDNVNVFSNGASLLLPTSAIGAKYTVNGWPQTIANSMDPEQDFDPTSTDEDLRAFLTIVGTADNTDVNVTFGDKVVKVVGAGSIPESGPGASLSLTIGRYDVVNLETQGFNADFTGTLIESSQPVTVFVGSEASDVPIFGTYSTRQCCADHLEAQLIPDASLGSNYTIARTPNRTKALAAAAFPDMPLGISVVNYPEWVRVLAVGSGMTTIKTSLPAPNDDFKLAQGADAILKADQDLTMTADKPIAVMQALPSQGVTGIPKQYPGGDPDLFPVPPIEQYRKDYIFLTPNYYAFDFVTIMAPAGTNILLDGAPLPSECEQAPGDGIERKPGEPPPDKVIYRCQLSFPKVSAGNDSVTYDGDQHDGVHTIEADREVGIIVNGFDRFVSYAYVGGLNLQVIN